MNQHDKNQTEDHRKAEAAVKEFVRSGGGIVGVCAGGFNVVWLGMIDADISRANGIGPHALEVADPEHPICAGVIQPTVGRTDRLWKPVPIIRYNGPIFFPKDPKRMVLSYDWEHRLGAVLAGDYGKGRAVAISPHPERVENEIDERVLDGPLMPCAGLLRNALYWSAGRSPE